MCDCASQHEPLINDTFVQVFGPMLIKFVIALLLLLYLTHQGMDFFSEFGLVLQMSFVLLFCLATWAIGLMQLWWFWDFYTSNLLLCLHQYNILCDSSSDGIFSTWDLHLQINFGVRLCFSTLTLWSMVNYWWISNLFRSNLLHCFADYPIWFRKRWFFSFHLGTYMCKLISLSDFA